MMMDGNYHLAGWRLPKSHADADCNVARWIEFAQILERGKFDMLFIADNVSPPGVDHPAVDEHRPRGRSALSRSRCCRRWQ